ncbi:unnamed protein product, partial [marine sediment metagenome]
VGSCSEIWFNENKCGGNQGCIVAGAHDGQFPDFGRLFQQIIAGQAINAGQSIKFDERCGTIIQGSFIHTETGNARMDGGNLEVRSSQLWKHEV